MNLASNGKFFNFFVVMSEDMVKDGYEDIVNIDISSVAIDMMKMKSEKIPQLKCTLFLQTFLLFPVALFFPFP